MDAEQFKTAFLPLHHTLYRVAFRLLESQAEAEDAVQETYLKLWDRKDSLSAIENKEAFCVTLIKNICLDQLRSEKYRQTHSQVALSEASLQTVEDDREHKEKLQQIEYIISHLPQNQQQVVMLRDLKGYSYEEIEQLTGLTSVNLRVLLSRARKKIREEFIKHYKQ